MALTSCYVGLIRRACLLVKAVPLCWGASHVMSHILTFQKAQKLAAGGLLMKQAEQAAPCCSEFFYSICISISSLI